MITKIGTFKTESNVLRITDPCYTKDTWCAGTLKNCEIGEWSAFLIDSFEGDWGNRVAQSLAIFGDISTEEAKKILDESDWKTSKIDVGVDSGQCGIFEDEKYPDGDPGEYGDKESFYGKCCNLTGELEPSGGVLDFGLVSSSGYGDGSYDCLFTHNKNNKIFAVTIVFIDQIESNFISNINNF